MPALFKNGFLIAIIAQGMIGSSLLWDKVLLKRAGTQNVYSYTFWLGMLSVFGVLLVPFGYHAPSLELIAIAFSAGVIDLLANLAYYIALKRSEASRAIAMVGGFSPVATAAFGYVLLTMHMNRSEWIGFILMTSGGFFMFLSEGLHVRKALLFIVLASVMAGLVNVLQKVIYNHTNFVTGYVWFTIGTFIGALAFLIPPSWRKQIFAETKQDAPSNRFWYFVNRFTNGLGAFLVFYAISRVNPDIVSAISGEQYAIVFLGVILLTKYKPNWLRENIRGSQMLIKAVATCLVISGIVLVAISGGSQTVGGPAAKLRNHFAPPVAEAVLVRRARRILTILPRVTAEHTSIR